MVLNRTAKSELAHTWEEGGTQYNDMGMKIQIRYVHLVPVVIGHASLQPWGSGVDA